MSFLDTVRMKNWNRKREYFPVFAVSFFALVMLGIFGGMKTVFAAATPPSIITYQGKLLSSGTAVNATTSIQLLIYDASAGGTLLYTAGGTIGTPAEIDVPINNGIFSVNMGAAGTNNVTSTVLADNATLYLEVIVEGTTLSPRKRLTATPYALNSTYLMGYGLATASTTEFIPRADANGNFSFTGTPQSSAVDGGVMYINPVSADADETLFALAVGGTEKFRVDEDGDGWFSGGVTATGTVTSSFHNVLVNDGITLGGEKRTTWPAGGGIDAGDDTTFTGVNTFSSSTRIKGKIGSPSILGTETDGTVLSGSSAVAVNGDYVYVTSFLDDSLNVMDVSSSTNPRIAATITGGAGSYLDRPMNLVTAGDYVYVVSYFGSSVDVFNVSNPTSPVLVSRFTHASISGPRSLYVSGNYLYVASADGNNIAIVDIADPKQLKPVSSFSDASISEPWSIYVSGKYAYVASETGDKLSIVDVSDPATPVLASSLADGGGVSPYLNGAHAVVVSGKYAYVAGMDSSRIQIVDVSDPTSPSAVASYDSSGFGAPVSLVAAEHYVYIYAGTSLVIVDVENPASPTYVGDVSLNTGNSLTTDHTIAIKGNRLYAAEYTSDNFHILDITGAVISNAQVDNISASNLDVRNNSYFTGDVSVRGGATVGANGLLLNGDFSMFYSTTSVNATNTLRFSHTTLFKTYTATTDTRAFIFDTANSLDISTTTYLFSVRNNGTPTFSIASNGNVNTTGTYYGQGAVIGTPGAPGDLAERVDIALDDAVEPGDVVVVDPHNTDTYRRSSKPYAQEVSGVVSTNPTIVVGNGKTEHTAVMAMVGRVPIKVSTENGPIVRGDLLITATTTGYAMRYDASKDGSGKIAGIVGVALESLAEGQGKIMGLVRTGWVDGQNQQAFAELRGEMEKMALGQGNNNDLVVEENDDGSIGRIDGDVDLNGFSLLAVRSIKGLNEKWEIDEDGRFTTKVETSEGSKTLYALQSENDQYVFSGKGTLVNGKTRIDFDETIREIVNTEKHMSINLTLRDKAKGIYVSEQDDRGFVVEEIEDGKSEANFDWMIFATRKNADDILNEEPEEEEPVEEPVEPANEPEAPVEEGDPVEGVQGEEKPVAEEDGPVVEEPAPANEENEAPPVEEPVQEENQPPVEEAPAQEEVARVQEPEVPVENPAPVEVPAEEAPAEAPPAEPAAVQ